MSSQRAATTSFAISSADRPEAYVPPTIAPMLVPVMQLMGMRISSSTFSTPTCARPRAPPPDSARPMRGTPGAAVPAATSTAGFAGGVADSGVCAPDGNVKVRPLSRTPVRAVKATRRSIIGCGSIGRRACPRSAPLRGARQRPLVAANCRPETDARQRHPQFNREFAPVLDKGHGGRASAPDETGSIALSESALCTS